LEKKKAVLFDWDGVLFDSLPAHLRHAEHCCEVRGINFRQAIGRPELDELSAYQLFLSSCQGHFSEIYKKLGIDYALYHEQITSDFIKFMSDESLQLFDTAYEMLCDLKEHYLIGLVTSSFRESVIPRLPYGFSFHSEVFAGEANPKPAPGGIIKCLAELGVKPIEALYVGDMISDAQAAAAAGVDFIGVTYGYNNHQALAAQPHLLIVDNVETLKKTLLTYSRLSATIT